MSEELNLHLFSATRKLSHSVVFKFIAKTCAAHIAAITTWGCTFKMFNRTIMEIIMDRMIMDIIFKAEIRTFFLAEVGLRKSRIFWIL